MQGKGFFNGMRDRMSMAMYNRYGFDGFGKFLFVFGLIFMIASQFIPNVYVRRTIYVLSILILIYEYMRIFSKKREKRARENYRYYAIIGKIKGLFGYGFDKNYRYFKCPGCKKRVRVPRHHGKTEITCKNCNTSFVKYTGKRK